MHNVERRSINDQRSTIEQRSINIRHTKMKKNPVEIFCSIFQTTRLNFLPTVHRGQRTEAKGGKGDDGGTLEESKRTRGGEGCPHRSPVLVCRAKRFKKNSPADFQSPPPYGLRSTVYGLRSTVYGLRSTVQLVICDII